MKIPNNRYNNDKGLFLVTYEEFKTVNNVVSFTKSMHGEPMMEPVSSSETSDNVFKTTRCNNP
jgi:hypothetical protein